MKTLILSNINKEVLHPGHFSFSNQASKILEEIYHSDKFNNILIINDRHCDGCNEFKFMPPHGLDNRAPSWFNKRYTLLNKSSFSVLGNDYNKKVIMGQGLLGDLYLAGFQLEMDIFASVVDFIRYGQTVTVIEDWTDGLVKDIRPKILDLFRFLNISVKNSKDC